MDGGFESIVRPKLHQIANVTYEIIRPLAFLPLLLRAAQIDLHPTLALLVEYLLLFLFRLRFRDRLLELVPFLRERGIFADVRQRETLVVLLRDFARRG